MRRLGILLALVTFTACSSHPTVEDAATEFSTALCQRLEECFPNDFANTYASIDACVARGLSSLPEGSEGKRSYCTEEQVDACVVDTREMECPATSEGIELPKSCENC